MMARARRYSASSPSKAVITAEWLEYFYWKKEWIDGCKQHLPAPGERCAGRGDW